MRNERVQLDIPMPKDEALIKRVRRASEGRRVAEASSPGRSIHPSAGLVPMQYVC